MDKKEVSIPFFYFFFNFHILLMLKCFWKYLLKVRQVKNRQFRKQYARTQLEKKRRRWYNAESEIFSRKNNPLRQLYTNKMCTFKTPTVRSLSCTKKRNFRSSKTRCKLGWMVQDRLVQDRLRTVVILVHLRSFTTVLVGFLLQKIPGYG